MLGNAITQCTISRDPGQGELLGTLPSQEEITQYWKDRAIEKYREIEEFIEHDPQTGLFVSKNDDVKVALGEHNGYTQYTISYGSSYETLTISGKELLKLFYGKCMSLDVHHIDGNEKNDRLENVRFLTHEEHTRVHNLINHRWQRTIGMTKRKGLRSKSEIRQAQQKFVTKQILESVTN